MQFFYNNLKLTVVGEIRIIFIKTGFGKAIKRYIKYLSTILMNNTFSFWDKKIKNRSL